MLLSEIRSKSIVLDLEGRAPLKLRWTLKGSEFLENRFGMPVHNRLAEQVEKPFTQVDMAAFCYAAMIEELRTNRDDVNAGFRKFVDDLDFPIPLHALFKAVLPLFLSFTLGDAPEEMKVPQMPPVAETAAEPTTV